MSLAWAQIHFCHTTLSAIACNSNITGDSGIWCSVTKVTIEMQVVQTAATLAQHLGKTVVRSQDRPGFIINRVLMPMINEAFYALMEVCNARDLPRRYLLHQIMKHAEHQLYVSNAQIMPHDVIESKSAWPQHPPHACLQHSLPALWQIFIFVL